jgi:methylamine dehydrogenase heavy chain
MRPGLLAWLLVLVPLVAGAPARSDLAPEPIGRVETLPVEVSPHWIWASDAVASRIALVDLADGRMLGVVDGGWGLTAGLFPAGGARLLIPETHYSRGSRGQRTDVVTFYDGTSLAPAGEVLIPAKRAFNALPVGNAALSDDDRFLAVFNMTPATSLSIVNLERRVFAGEVAIPGCALVYGAGPRRFLTVCADGTLLLVELDDQGNAIRKVRSDAFFDANADPITEKAVRRGDVWYFVSFEGRVHEVDVSGPLPSFRAPWSLFDEVARADRWRVGGRQLLTVHRTSGRLFALVHQGGPDTHKEAGREAWVYDLERRERVQRIALRNPGLTYLGVPMSFGEGWIWPFNRIYDALLSLTPLGVASIAVTQDDEPILVTGSEFSGSLALYDATSGEFLRRIATGNMTNLVLQAPYGGPTR